MSAGSLSWSAGQTVDHGAEVYRILYTTTGGDGALTAASARLAVPRLDPPAGGFPLVAHLHGTLGFADECAPSRERKLGFESSSNPIAARMLSEGFAVVEPDYPGLGTPGPHPYTARQPTGRSALDAVRAASRFRDPDRGIALGDPPSVAIEGHSQGGHAVLSALGEAPDYAPELPIAAAVAISTPASPIPTVGAILREDRYAGFAALSLLGLSFAHPELSPLESWFLPGVGEALSARVEEHCLGRLSDVVGTPADQLFQPETLEALAAEDPAAVGLEGVLLAEDIGDLATDVPLLVVHGGRDPLLPLGLTEAMVADIGARSAAVEWLPVDDGDHGTLPWAARGDICAFLLERLP